MKNVRDTYTLNNGSQIPCLGYGTWQMPNDETGYQAVSDAIDAGFRHIDTAQGYKNEEVVGKAIMDSGVKREDIFLTTKLDNPNHGYEKTRETFLHSLQELQTDYVDLFLIHWPNPLHFRENWKEVNRETWRAMEEFYKEGKIKAIGVSNFRIHHLEALLESAEIIPAVNQIRLCPGDVDEELVAWCRKKDILLQAYSPLGTGKVLLLDEVKEIAKKYNTSEAHVALSWSIQMGFQPLVKSVRKQRIIDNTKFFDVTLAEEDMKKLNALKDVVGHANDPDTVAW